MTIEARNKNLVREFCQAFSDGDWDRIEELCSPEFRWKVPTSQRRQSSALVAAPLLNEDPGWTREEMLVIFRDLQRGCVDGRFDLVPIAFTAEGIASRWRRRRRR
jgi:ketosteroid isomerase-like protein